MQRIFYEDLRSQPPVLGQESAIDTWEDEVDDYLARAVYENMQLNADKVCCKVIAICCYCLSTFLNMKNTK